MIPILNSLGFDAMTVHWETDFMATGAMRGIGWAVLYHDNVSGKFFSFWINEHDQGHPVDWEAVEARLK